MQQDSKVAAAVGVAYNCGGGIIWHFRTCYSYAKHQSSDCGSEVLLRPGDVIICRECGYRILYKKRTKQGKTLTIASLLTISLQYYVVVQFEAR